GVGRGEQGRGGAEEAVLAAAQRFRRDVLHLAGDPVIFFDFAAVDGVRVERVGGDVAVLLGADRPPVAEGDLAVVAPADDASGAALLLAAVDPVGELVVGADVVELGRRLVVPAAPGLAAVDRDRRTLVGGQQDDLWVVGVDPDRVVVVAAGGALEGGEGLAAVGRAVQAGVGDVNDVG